MLSPDLSKIWYFIEQTIQFNWLYYIIYAIHNKYLGVWTLGITFAMYLWLHIETQRDHELTYE